MTRTFNLYRSAHLLPDGPFTETEKAELLQALFFIRAALGDEAPDHRIDGLAREYLNAHPAASVEMAYEAAESAMRRNLQ